MYNWPLHAVNVFQGHFRGNVWVQFAGHSSMQRLFGLRLRNALVVHSEYSLFCQVLATAISHMDLCYFPAIFAT